MGNVLYDVPPWMASLPDGKITEWPFNKSFLLEDKAREIVLARVLAKLLQSYPTLCDAMGCSPPGSSVWDSSDKNTGVGCHALLQGILPTQGLNLHLLCLLH